MVNRLRELRTLEGIASCSAALRLMTHLQLSEPQAEHLLLEIVRHREELTRWLERDPGIQVAAIDYLYNVRSLLRNPAVVEMSQLQQTERYAITDPLTDLYNRRYFQNALETEIRRSRRHSLAMALLMLDLDSFKSVNDVYGHPFGDRVLRRSGQVVRRAVRESDTACRFGGEEFAVVLPETDRLGGLAVGDRVRNAIREDFGENPVDGRLVAMTISGGVACYPADGDTADGLIARADQALYRSKAGGRNTVVIHHSEKRRSVRYPVKRTATARLAARPEGESTTAAPIDLSESGALLETRGAYRPAESVELTIEGGSQPCRLIGRVVRVESKRDATQRHRVAIAFEHPMPASTLLEHVVRGRPGRLSFGDRV